MKKALFAVIILCSAAVLIVMREVDVSEPSAMVRNPGDEVLTEVDVPPVLSSPEVEREEIAETGSDESAQDEDRPVDATVAFVATVEVTVRSENSGDVVPSALVLLDMYGNGVRYENRFTARAGSDGIARFELPSTGYVRVSLLCGAYDSLTVGPGDTQQLELTIPAGVTVKGSVIDGGGNRLARASIWVSAAADRSRGRIAGKTDEKGEYVLRDVQNGQYVGARMEGYAPSHLLRITAATGREERCDFALTEVGGRVSGRVLDSAGLPLANAEVCVGAEGATSSVQLSSGLYAPGPPPARGNTDADGLFEFRSVPIGVQPLRVRARGHAPHMGEVVLAVGNPARVDVRLESESRVLGQVWDEFGEPVASALIHTPDLDPFLQTSVFSGPEGMFDLGGLPAAGSVRVVAEEKEYGQAESTFELTPGSLFTWDPTLLASPSILGTIVDAEGAPLTGWLVSVFDESKPPPNWTHANTDDEGYFIIAGLGSMPHRVEVKAPGIDSGFPRLTIDSVEPSPQEVRWTVRDDMFATVRGSVVDPGGTGVASARIWIWHEQMKTSRSFGVEASDGGFVIDALPPGTCSVEVRSEEYPPKKLDTIELKEGDSEDFGPIVLELASRLVGRISWPSGFDPSTLSLRLSGATGSATSVITRTEERYVSGPLEPGEYTLNVRGDYVLSQRIPVVIEDDSKEHTLDVTLERAEMRLVLVDLPEGETKAAVGGAWCSVMAENGSQVWMNGNLPWVDDIFEARVSLAPGKYRAKVHSSAGWSAEGELEIRGSGADGEPLRLTLRKG